MESTQPKQSNYPRNGNLGLLVRIKGALTAYAAGLLERKPSNGETLVELDGLRGLAVLLVIASHSNLWHLRGSGATGVWLFFVLSAFLLTKIMLANMPGSIGGAEIAKYLIRRVARILPPYYLCLALLAFEGGKSLEWFFRHCLFMQADGHLWSIPQEELFYLTLPILVTLVYLLNRWLRLPKSITAGILVVSLNYFPPFVTLSGNGGRISFYLNIFILGFFLAHLWKTNTAQSLRNSRRFLPLANIVGIVCLLALLSAGSKEHLAYYSKFVPVTADYLAWKFPAVFAAISTVLIFATLTPNSWTQRIFAWPGLRILGVLSFSLYLTHYRVLQILAQNVGLAEGVPLFMGTLVVSLLIAIVFERIIERPSIRLGRRINSRLWPDKKAN